MIAKKLPCYISNNISEHLFELEQQIQKCMYYIPILHYNSAVLVHYMYPSYTAAHGFRRVSGTA